MDANAEVMPAVVKSSTRQAPMQSPREPRLAEATKSAVERAPTDSRLSEDPMRRTDRYRLVMPYSLRV